MSGSDRTQPKCCGTFFQLKMNTTMTKKPISYQLNDGTTVFIRFLRPEDRDELNTGFSKLSAASRYNRFFSCLRCLPESLLTYLTEIDNINHLALCAYVEEVSRPVGIGVARYCRIQDDDESAEFAVTILDAYQNKGLGARLLSLLMEYADKNGIRKLVGYVLPANGSMLNLCRKMGAKVVWSEHSTFLVEISLPRCHLEKETRPVSTS